MPVRTAMLTQGAVRGSQLVAAVAIAALMGCTPRPTIGVDTAGGTEAVVFTFTIAGRAEPPTLAAFRVDSCMPIRGAPFEAVWLTRSPSDEGQPIGRITYGVPPAGWRSVQGPHPLLPGCYRAAISRAAPFEFDVQPDGRIIERR